jgi:ketosteroid isomerase-like protein
MKNYLLLLLSVLLFISCSDKRYTQQSPEIETYKKVIADYENQNWESFATHYADTAKIYNNATKDKGQSLSQFLETNKQDAAMFSSWSYADDGMDYEMVVTDKGETWVNFWGLWQGVRKADGKTYDIPSHITARFIDGKIVAEHGYWDNSELIKNPHNVEVINSLYEYFGTGEIPKVLELMDPEIVWNEAEGNTYADGNPYVGPEAVLNGVFARIGAEHEYFKVQDVKLHNMLNNKVLATLRYDAKYKNGGAYNVQVAHLWTLENGKITAFQQYVDTKGISDALKR